MSYLKSKQQIKKVGYANVGGDALTLSHAEILSDHLHFNAMSKSPRTMDEKIYNWFIKYKIDSSKLIHWVVGDKKGNNIWIFWTALLDDKNIEF